MEICVKPCYWVDLLPNSSFYIFAFWSRNPCQKSQCTNKIMNIPLKLVCTESAAGYYKWLVPHLCKIITQYGNTQSRSYCICVIHENTRSIVQIQRSKRSLLFIWEDLTRKVHQMFAYASSANGIHECSLYIKDGNGHSDITHWFCQLTTASSYHR